MASLSTPQTEADLELMDRKGGICPSCLIRVRYEPTTSEIRAMKAEATRKYLKLFKVSIVSLIDYLQNLFDDL